MRPAWLGCLAQILTGSIQFGRAIKPTTVQKMAHTVEHVALTHAPSAASRALISNEFMKFLLFQRLQIPAPFDQFEAACHMDDQPPAAGLAPRRMQNPLLRRKRMFACAIRSMLDEMSQAFQSADGAWDIAELLVLFGPTVLSSREAYSLRFVTDSEQNCIAAPASAASNAARAFVRHLITSPAEALSRHLDPCGIHVLVAVREPSGSASGSDATPSLPLDLFAPQPRFDLCARRSLKCSLLLLVGHAHDLADVTEVDETIFSSRTLFDHHGESKTNVHSFSASTFISEPGTSAKSFFTDFSDAETAEAEMQMVRFVLSTCP